MRCMIMLAMCISFSLNAWSYDFKDQVKDGTYQRRVDHFEHRPIASRAIVMLGDSLTDMGGWNEFFPRNTVLNRGISGDTVYGVMSRLQEVARHKPKKIFVLVGVNDLFHGEPVPSVLDRYAEMVKRLLAITPHIYLQSVFPINPQGGADMQGLTNARIVALNAGIQKIAASNKLPYVDVYSKLVDSRGNLNLSLTFDGIHVNGRGYDIWRKTISSMVKN